MPSQCYRLTLISMISLGRKLKTAFKLYSKSSATRCRKKFVATEPNPEEFFLFLPPLLFLFLPPEIPHTPHRKSKSKIPTQHTPYAVCTRLLEKRTCMKTPSSCPGKKIVLLLTVQYVPLPAPVCSDVTNCLTVKLSKSVPMISK